MQAPKRATGEVYLLSDAKHGEAASQGGAIPRLRVVRHAQSQRKKYRRNLELFYVAKVFSVMVGFMFPCTLQLYTRIGMSDGEIAWLQAIFAIIFAPLLLMGGACADRIGRKIALISGTILFAIGMSMYGFANSFGDLVFAEVVLAVSMGLITGAEHAIIFDSLRALGAERCHPAFRARLSAMSALGLGITCFLGSFLAKFRLELPFLLAAAGYTLSVIPLLLMVEPPGKKVFHVQYAEQLLQVVRDSFRNGSQVRATIVIGALVFNATFLGRPLLQALYRDLGVPEIAFGAILLMGNLLAAYAMRYNKRILVKAGAVRSCLIAALLAGMGYCILGSQLGLIVLLMVPIIFWANGFQDTVVPDLLNQGISSEDRAAINSLIPALGRVVTAILLLPAGAIAAHCDVATAHFCIGCFALIVAITVWRQLRKGSAQN